MLQQLEDMAATKTYWYRVKEWHPDLIEFLEYMVSYQAEMYTDAQEIWKAEGQDGSGPPWISLMGYFSSPEPEWMLFVAFEVIGQNIKSGLEYVEGSLNLQTNSGFVAFRDPGTKEVEELGYVIDW